MSIDAAPLIEALNRLQQKLGGYGAWSEMARQSGLRSNSIARIAKGEGTPRPESWDKLHKAYPNEIPAPPWVIGSQSAQHPSVPALSKRQQAVLEVVMRECPNAELVHHFIGGEVFIADANDHEYEEPEGDDVNLYIVEIKGKQMVGEIKPLDDGWIVEEATTGKLYSAPSEWGDWVKGVVFFTGQMVDRAEGGEDEEGIESQ